MFAFSSLPYYLIIHTGHIGAGNGLMGPLVMWCPGFAACGLFKIDLATLSWNWRPALAGMGLRDSHPLRTAGLRLRVGDDSRVVCVLGIRRSLGSSFRVSGSSTCRSPIPCHPWLCHAERNQRNRANSGRGNWVAWISLSSTGASDRFTWSCLINGCIWAVWHYPGLLFADYNAGTEPAFALTCFTLMVFAASFIWGWLRLKSGSLWTAAILHASHNIFIQIIFDGMTVPVDRTLYTTTEFGAGLVLTMGGLPFISGPGATK